MFSMRLSPVAARHGLHSSFDIASVAAAAILSCSRCDCSDNSVLIQIDMALYFCVLQLREKVRIGGSTLLSLANKLRPMCSPANAK